MDKFKNYRPYTLLDAVEDDLEDKVVFINDSIGCSIIGYARDGLILENLHCDEDYDFYEWKDLLIQCTFENGLPVGKEA